VARGVPLGDILSALARRGGHFLLPGLLSQGAEARSIEQWAETLLSSTGEASGTAIAASIIDYWRALDDAGRRDFLRMLRDRLGVDRERLDAAVEAYVADRADIAAADLHRSAEPRRQDFFRRLNLAPGGIETLVHMREDLLACLGKENGLEAVDADFVHLFTSWFNRGFLMLKRIDWTTPANILEKIIRYEAVHAIESWDDLRRRLQPDDRRCYAFFHPRLPDEPLIFVEVALTQNMPDAIAPLLSEDRPGISAEEGSHAVFYSISNCQAGLRGVSFGNFLIKQVAEDLRRELPNLKQFVTLSPVPGFAGWLEKTEASVPGIEDVCELVAQPGWENEAETLERLGELLPPIAAHYFLVARDVSGRVVDPVARFHLGNGASLARINAFGDLSPKALKSALGVMVNYRYLLDEVEKNHERFASRAEVAAAPAVRNLIGSRRSGRGAKWSTRSDRSVA
jgi:malonyl-CoA decarboxylase